MAFPRLEELKNNLKTLQPKPDEVPDGIYDMLLNTAVKQIISEVVAFTNVPAEELPEDIDSSLLMKLSGWFTDAGVFMSADDRHSGAVTSIKEGDTQVNYGSPQQALQSLGRAVFVDETLRPVLMRYRRIRGW